MSSGLIKSWSVSRSNMGENQQQQQQRFQLGTIGALSLSVVSSVSIVICNKALITTLGFCFGQFASFCLHFCWFNLHPAFFMDWFLLFTWILIAATTLTSWHLLVTFCSLHVALWVKLFEHKGFDQKTVLGFGILNGTSIGLLNLSLGFNSVGFYQVTSITSLNFPLTNPLAFVDAWYRPDLDTSYFR